MGKRMTIQLRPAVPADTAALADLGRRAVSAKFQHLYKPEDFATFLGQAHSEAKVAKEIADPGMRIAVIEEDGALIAFCRERLAHFKCPTRIEQVESLPRTATGKLQKFKLRDVYWQGDRRVQ